MTQAPLELVAYDARWPAMFEAEKALLEPLLAAWRRGPIEHVGSTAVAGMCAKPIIDIMVGVTSLADSAPAIDVVSRVDYLYAAYKTDVMHWFCKPSPARRTHHLHLVPFGSPLWDERLRFRDRLRESQVLAGEYAALKLELARRFPNDREAYTDGKTPFIARVLAAAHADV